MRALKRKLGFVHDKGDAIQKFNLIVKLKKLTGVILRQDTLESERAAIDEAKLTGLNEEDTAWLVRHSGDNSDLQAVQDESLFLMVHACLEFTLVQLYDHLATIENNNFTPPKAKDYRPFLETVALKIGEIGGVKNVFNSDTWHQILLLTRVRNAITHAQAYQDHEFSNVELDILSKLGFGTTCQVGHSVASGVLIMPPLFFMKDVALITVVHLYKDFLEDLVEKLEAK